MVKRTESFNLDIRYPLISEVFIELELILLSFFFKEFIYL